MSGMMFESRNKLFDHHVRILSSLLVFFRPQLTDIGVLQNGRL
jgi:hypothetical protein